MRNVTKKYNPSEENASIIVSINKYGRVLSNWEYLKEIEKLEDIITKAIEKLKEHKQDLDYEPWSIYQIEGSILFDLVNILKGSDKE